MALQANGELVGWGGGGDARDGSPRRSAGFDPEGRLEPIRSETACVRPAAGEPRCRGLDERNVPPVPDALAPRVRCVEWG